MSDNAETMAAAEGRIQKMEVDYSSTVDEKLPKCEKLVKVSIVFVETPEVPWTQT